MHRDGARPGPSWTSPAHTLLSHPRIHASAPSPPPGRPCMPERKAVVPFCFLSASLAISSALPPLASAVRAFFVSPAPTASSSPSVIVSSVPPDSRICMSAAFPVASSPLTPASSTAPSPDQRSRRLKILCLHGYLQSASIFRGKLGSLRKGLKSKADFVFLDAPFLAQARPSEDLLNAWTDQTPEGSLQPRPSKALHYTGVAETTIPFLKQALAEHAPDGLLAFSQGATAAAILLAALQRDEREGKGQKEGVSLPKFAILVGGFFPRDEAVGQGVKEGAPRLPTMFVGGAADQLVPLTRTRELMACWDEAEKGWITLHEHGGGHFVPTWKGEFKEDVVRFVDRFTSGEGIKGR
ncbi:Serine hydrolase FSH [Nannochloropsis gaditana]|uniref:Serine hydrolase FSH n=2 Tax=Nannochloropsis gaditana TaxID=72520 RepID=W7THF7_9STRA|nr:Serine hydrolase FSH [Nannochloropsis gaditana]